MRPFMATGNKFDVDLMRLPHRLKRLNFDVCLYCLCLYPSTRLTAQTSEIFQPQKIQIKPMYKPQPRSPLTLTDIKNSLTLTLNYEPSSCLRCS